MKKKDLLDKWLNDELTPEEFEVIRTIPEFSSYQKIDDFAKRIELPHGDPDRDLPELKQKINSKKRKSGIISLNVVYRIAAILILILTSFYFISNYKVTERTELAMIEQIILPDDSKVYINENSEIKYKRNKWSSERTISLIGEAYFEVTKGDTFKVETSFGTVSVIGTKFNVVARDDHFSVHCFEGMVRIFQNDVAVDLPRGKSMSLLAGELILDNTFISGPGWLFDESTFNDVVLTDVISELKKQYQINVTTENIDVNLRFTGSFPNKDLEAALQAITLPFNLSYSLENKDAVKIFGKINSE